MNARLDQLVERLGDALPKATVSKAFSEVSLEVRAADWVSTAMTLRDHPGLRFEQLIDLCAVDWSDYAERGTDGPRYGVVIHLLSVTNNLRLRVKTGCPDDDFPLVASLVDVWPGANWYEREAFDLIGVVFEGHPDLRRLLTDYGFVGHPFRKDFPISGHVEMRYDPKEERVIYQAVSIEPRNNVPRIVREEHYGDSGH